VRIAVVAGESQVFAVVCSAMLASNEVLDVKGIDVNLPTATSAQANNLPDFTIVGIDALMDIYFEKEKVAKEDVLPRLQKLYGSNHNVRIFVRADKDATYENVVFVLDKARTAGIQKVSLEIKAYDSSSGSAPTPSSAEPAVSPSPASH
jgi:biopolymer transport protein ExbD